MSTARRRRSAATVARRCRADAAAWAWGVDRADRARDRRPVHLAVLLRLGQRPAWTRRSALAYVVMALGLNIIVGFAGLLDLGYVAFFAIGAYTMGWLGSGFSDVNDGEASTSSSPAPRRACPGIHLNFLIVLVFAAVVHDDRGHDPRPADAAPARRLHRDRDACVRRDHRPRRRRERRRAASSGSATPTSPPAARASRRSTRSTCPFVRPVQR